MEDRPYLTVKEVAVYLRVHTITVRRLMKRGKIKFFMVGGRPRIPKAFLRTNT
jgi:excisionase family DNA binding protein